MVPMFGIGKSTLGRFQVLFTPNEDLEVRLSLRGGKRDSTGTPYDHEVAFPTGFGGTGEYAPPGSTDFLGFAEPDSDPFTVSIDDVSKMEAESWGATATVVWDIGEITLTSVTDYSGVDFDAAEDSDVSPGEFFHFVGETQHEQFSQELRLNGSADALRWTVGAYFLRIDGEFDQRGLITDLGFGVDEQVALYEVETTSYSLFGQIEYDVTDALMVTVGARWILDDREQDYENFFTYTMGSPERSPSAPVVRRTS